MVKLIDWESEPSQFNMQLQEHISWDQQKLLDLFTIWRPNTLQKTLLIYLFRSTELDSSIIVRANE